MYFFKNGEEQILQPLTCHNYNIHKITMQQPFRAMQLATKPVVLFIKELKVQTRIYSRQIFSLIIYDNLF